MPNRLALESSLYLRQHGENPIDWYPWGPEALARARRLQRPILLSIGYSACHWCHVMERESFEDPDVAELVNEAFVAIKVDREERPDLDDLYMRAVQAFTDGRGGWPMTLFLTPDGHPFLGGTYFPPEPRQGLPSFRQVCTHADQTWRERRAEADSVAEEVGRLLATGARGPVTVESLSDDWLDRVAEEADLAFDPEHGGFGGAPKFPPHGTLAALLAHWRRTGRQRSLDLAVRTLDAMAAGGMYDLIGGGFARYSVDASWTVPHFEKMLYDQGQLIPLYVDAWRITGRARFADVARQTADYLLRELLLPSGGLAAAEDADSEGEEGRFYAWTVAEVRAAVGPAKAMLACALLGVTADGTLDAGRSVLRSETPIDQLEPAERALYDEVVPRLLAARDKRERPLRDNKIVTGWNALAISALARAGTALDEPRYVEAAVRVARLLWTTGRPEGRLVRVIHGTEARVPATVDDHGALLLALVDLWEATFQPQWLEHALVLADDTVARFFDAEGDLPFLTAHDAEPLVARSRRLVGGAEPSGTESLALGLVRLGTLCGRQDLLARADRMLRALQAFVERAPLGLGAALIAGAWRTGRTREIGIVGPGPEALLRVVRRRYDPFCVLAWVAGPGSTLLPWMADRAATVATAHVCEGFTCLVPTDSAEALAQQLARRPDRPARLGGVRVRAPNLPADPDAWLNTDRPLRLADLEGHVVVLDFWTYCCMNCQHVLPVLAEIEERFAGRPVVIIGVHAAKFPAEREAENVARAVARHRIRHPVVLDPDHVLWDQYAIRAWPTLTVIDPTGRVAWQQSGEVDANKLGDVVQALLDDAATDGNLGVPVWTPAAVADVPGDLAFPGKVHVWPGPAVQAQGADPFGADARLYVSDTGHARVIECALTLGTDGWPVARALRVFDDGFAEPQGLSRDGETLWVADPGAHRVFRVDLATERTFVAVGSGRLGRNRPFDPGRPRQVPLRSPWDVEAMGDMVLIAMAGNHQIWLYLRDRDRVGPFIGTGAEAHVDGESGDSALAQPSDLALFGNLLFWADSETSSVRVFDFGSRKVGTVVGKGLFDFGDVDGAPDQVLLQHPLGLTFAERTAYVADTYNHKIKAIDLAHGGVTRTLATGLCEPGGVEIAGDFLVVADTGHHRLCVVDRRSGELRPLPLLALDEATSTSA